MQEETLRELIAWRRAKPRWTGSYDYFASRGSYAGKLTKRMFSAPLGLPPIITAKEAVMAVFRSPLLLERLCAADWLSSGDKEEVGPVFRTQAVYMALARMSAGQKPPRMAKEKPLKAHAPEIGDALPRWKYVKTAQAAEMLGISPRTLSFYAERGTVPCLRLGKHRLFSIAEVVEHLSKTTERKRLRPGDIAAVLR